MAKIYHIIFLTAAILLKYEKNNKVNAIHIKSKDDEMSIADLTASFKE